MNRLSDAERVLGHDVSASMPGRWYAEEVVEAIVAARLASVEALADEWERAGNRLIKKYRNGTSPAAVKRAVEGYAFLRGAEGLRDTIVLGSDAHTEGSGHPASPSCSLRSCGQDPSDAHTEQKGAGA